MFTELYIGALLADERLADFVWDLWNGDEIDGPSPDNSVELLNL